VSAIRRRSTSTCTPRAADRRSEHRLGAIHTYSVTVDFTIDTDITTEAADCVVETEELGTGTLNTATLEYSQGTLTDSACVPVPSGGGAGGGGGGGGGGKPPTDTLVPTDVVTAAPANDGPGLGHHHPHRRRHVLAVSHRRHRYAEA
jgi:hypothetical protein